MNSNPSLTPEDPPEVIDVTDLVQQTGEQPGPHELNDDQRRRLEDIFQSRRNVSNLSARTTEDESGLRNIDSNTATIEEEPERPDNLNPSVSAEW